MSEKRGIIEQHQHRKENEPDYRDAALTAPRGPGLSPAQAAATAAEQETVETQSVNVDDLKGEALEQAVTDADIEGRSSMSAAEKRAALRERSQHAA